MSRLGRAERRKEARSVFRHGMELLGVFARFGRSMTRNPRPRDGDRKWTGWHARDVVIGETLAEKRRRRAGLSIVDTTGFPK